MKLLSIILLVCSFFVGTAFAKTMAHEPRKQMTFTERLNKMKTIILTPVMFKGLYVAYYQRDSNGEREATRVCKIAGYKFAKSFVKLDYDRNGSVYETRSDPGGGFYFYRTSDTSRYAIFRSIHCIK